MNRKKILIAIVLLALAGYFGYNYMYQDHRDIGSEAAKVEASAGELLKMFSDNATPEVLNSTVLVSGIVTEIESQSLTIDGAVQCSFDGEITEIKVDDKVVIKGRCIGYDELFEIVKLDQSTLIK